MNMQKKPVSSWLERVEDIIQVLEGSTVGEIELTEGETEIIIRRSPGLVLTASATMLSTQAGRVDAQRAAKADQSIPIVAPLTGVYYSAASPTTPPFVSVGDVVHVGQVVALIEAMKVFNEITAEATGRVVMLASTNGAVVQKGDVLLRIEPV
ncbi:MAG TPA: biotin/lipoyl-containing protein [Ktedonobacteraceae bacterium]|jgi:biotin carboxyl carrier protein